MVVLHVIGVEGYFGVTQHDSDDCGCGKGYAGDPTQQCYVPNVVILGIMCIMIKFVLKSKWSVPGQLVDFRKLMDNLDIYVHVLLKS